MDPITIRIRSITHLAPHVLCIVTQKPPGYRFIPGQSAAIAINQPGWLQKKRYFSFTCLPENNYLEFIIKIYPARNMVTNRLLTLKAGDQLLLHNPLGAMAYKSEGVFIAGGTGITPFICILRQLWHQKMLNNNRLILANRTKADIILPGELKAMLGDRFFNILSGENIAGYEYGPITPGFIKAHSGGLNKHFYLCGPPGMTTAVAAQLKDLGVRGSSIIQEDLKYSHPVNTGML